MKKGTATRPFNSSALAIAGLLVLALQACNYRIAFASPLKKKQTTEQRELVFFTDAFAGRLDSAKLAGRPVFIDFYTSWCGPCKIMDRDVFTDPTLAAYLNENFVNLKVNAEVGEGVALAGKFEIMGYPTLVFIDASGKEQKRLLGMAKAARLQQLGEKVHKSK
ncbi:MAG: thioredoxin family protein [Lewinellaceae bacterium]|nr:thioredoxin family protein [Lewinellaceae bacterium]